MKQLVSTINATGGLQEDPAIPSYLCPVADPDWVDLGVAAEEAYTQCLDIEQVLLDVGAPIPDSALCESLDGSWRGPRAVTESELLEDWQYEVTNGDTRLGFEEWKQHREDVS